MELFKASLNNNSLIAQDHLETKLAMVVLWTMPSNTSRLTELLPKLNIHIKLLNKPAAKMVVLSKLQDSLMSIVALIWLMHLLVDQFQLPLMLPTGHPTNQVFSITAKLPSTTVSSQSVLVINIGKSRTLGELHGEKVDSSDLPQETLAVSATLLHIQQNDLA